MFNNKRKIVINSIGIIVFIMVLMFAWFRYSRYRIGPEIIAINLDEFMTVEKASLSVHAELKNVQSVLINERNIILHDKISFDEILVFSPGINIIEIGLNDTFGKIKSYTYTLYYKNQKTDLEKTLSQAKNTLKKSTKAETLTNIKQQ